MKEQLLAAWTIHHGKNLLLLQHIPEDLLACSLSAKGRTAGEQIAHLHNVRINWTEFVAKPFYQKSLLLSKDATLTLAVLSEALTTSAGIINKVIDQSWDKEGKLPSFKAGLIPFISYLISHESHHRGNILLTLKQSGYQLPDKLKWGLWEWNSASAVPSVGGAQV
jgi:uncharacterized damage-inducible protein DinB